MTEDSYPRIAIFCHEYDLTALRVLHYFKENGMPISLVIIEKPSLRKRGHQRLITWELMEKRYAPNIIRRAIAKFFRVIGLPGVLQCYPEARLFQTLSVAEASARLGIPCVRVLHHSSNETKAILENNDISYVLLVSSNDLIKEPLLSMPNTRIINAHCAKLPRHRSLDALPWSVYENDDIGMTTHFVDAGIDTGDILLFIKVLPKKDDDLVTLRKRVDILKPEIFLKTIEGLRNGTINPIPQSASDGIHHRPMNEEEFERAEKILQKRINELYPR